MYLYTHLCIYKYYTHYCVYCLLFWHMFLHIFVYIFMCLFSFEFMDIVLFWVDQVHGDGVIPGQQTGPVMSSSTEKIKKENFYKTY